ncbi:MAG: hypothetical protein ABSE73_09355 [Planctomycetota bacterium]
MSFKFWGSKQEAPSLAIVAKKIVELEGRLDADTKALAETEDELQEARVSSLLADTPAATVKTLAAKRTALTEAVESEKAALPLAYTELRRLSAEGGISEGAKLRTEAARLTDQAVAAARNCIPALVKINEQLLAGGIGCAAADLEAAIEARAQGGRFEVTPEQRNSLKAEAFLGAMQRLLGILGSMPAPDLLAALGDTSTWARPLCLDAEMRRIGARLHQLEEGGAYGLVDGLLLGKEALTAAGASPELIERLKS